MTTTFSRRRLLAALPLGLAMPIARAAARSPRYTVQVLPLDDRSSIRIAGMAGDFVAGNSYQHDPYDTEPGLTAVLWDHRHLQFRRPFGQKNTGIWGVNTLGTMIGHCNVPGLRDMRAVRIPLDRPAETLLPRQLEAYSIALAINDAGVIVGHYHLRNDWRYQGFRWANGVHELLPSPSPDCVNHPAGINAEGTIVGRLRYQQPDGQFHGGACVYRGDELTFLPADPDFHSEAVAINDEGWIVGHQTSINNFYAQPVLWRLRDGAYRLRRLPVPPGAMLSRPAAINASGAVVGTAEFVGGNPDYWLERGWVWDRGELLLLDDVVGELPPHVHITRAHAIDAQGRIGVTLQRYFPGRQERMRSSAVLHPIAP
ncbi:MAG TPA: hypothetical protein VFY73_01540 [Ideonella sp.]|uniref:hypothetical protein n=1 Tax=Ideonella sp. TaxID=1929293 RepID=UPI002E304192|nr:hypothetical protein [Ideonella sp.]HEX5682691.1 hypothetical protein [Ideonella sp.]